MSNELVAASCAAIIAVYAAGYWRTRDADQRFAAGSPVRRAGKPAPRAQAEPPSPPAADLTAPPAPQVPASVPTVNVSAPEAAPLPAPAAMPESPPPAPESKPVEPSSAKTETTELMPQLAGAVPGQPEAVPPVLPAEPATSSQSPWRDGTYTGWGLSRHGDIEARVTIKNGGIVAVGIATCATRYPCYVIDEILQQPLYRQSPDVDRVSRATESSDAYSDAVWQALQKAEAEPASAAPP